MVKDFKYIISPFQGSEAIPISDYNHIILSGLKAGTAGMIIEKQIFKARKPGTGDILLLT